MTPPAAAVPAPAVPTLPVSSSSTLPARLLEIRRNLAEGFYDDPDRIDVLVDRLACDVIRAV